MNAVSQNVRGVILAGGSGTRLWPLSRAQSPKQFSKLLGEDTLLEATVARLQPLVPRENVLIVTSEETASGEGFALLEPFEKILEPVARNTAAAIGVAAVRCRMDGGDPILVVLPADHFIRDVAAFQSSLVKAIAVAESGKLVTFGIVPDRAETGFGYIEAGEGDGVASVRSFREKPDRATAETYLASGRHYWNSGIFVWKTSAILAEIGTALPSLARALEKIAAASTDAASFAAAVKAHFAEAPSISIDHGVLEKSRNLAMVKAEFDWSDVGSWDAVFDVSDKDPGHNVLQGNVLAIRCNRTFVRSHGRLVAAVDLQDISVVETRDAVLVMRRGSSQGVGEVVMALSERSATEHLAHVTVRRPWGAYTVLEEGPSFKIKRSELRPRGRMSLHRHRHRSEHWVVISGEARVTRGDEVETLRANQSTFIPPGTKHRLENPLDTPLHIIEVQVGSYVGEDDIERFDDQYGRK